MAPDVASRPSMSSQSTIAPDVARFVTCPLCHTADPTMTHTALSAGADWHCSRCGQRWNATRLTVVAGYVAWAQGGDRGLSRLAPRSTGLSPNLGTRASRVSGEY